LVKDITERKKIEDELLHGRHFLQSIADTLPDVVTVLSGYK
jgi:PAS domain-containing protein